MKVAKVLVVDDSKVVQFKLRRMLEARGLVVDTAASGRESLDYLKTKMPDVIFMDFMMADMDGYEVTSQITANPETAAIPVIMCTGHDPPADRERAKESGASGFVTKPRRPDNVGNCRIKKLTRHCAIYAAFAKSRDKRLHFQGFLLCRNTTGQMDW